MKRAVLVCNGSLDTKYLYANVSKDDFIIAIDGGANKLLKTSFVPKVIIGDMDSISNNASRKFRSSEFIKFPAKKDQVDLELGLNYCIEHKFREILIIGAMGNRADMVLTNIFILSKLPSGFEAKLVHENQEIFLVPKNFTMNGNFGEAVSFIALSRDVKGLTLKGFKYDLDNFDLGFGFGVGVSNEFKNKKVSITFKDGLLLCVYFRKWF